MRASLSSGLASAMKSSTPASAAMAAAGIGLSPVIITVRMPILRHCATRTYTPTFPHFLAQQHAEPPCLHGDDERRPAGLRDVFDGLGNGFRAGPAIRTHPAEDGLRRPFPSRAPFVQRGALGGTHCS